MHVTIEHIGVMYGLNVTITRGEQFAEDVFGK